MCDQHDYIEEMVKYLHDNRQLKYIEMYIQKRSPMKTPAVIGALLDCGRPPPEESVGAIPPSWVARRSVGAIGSVCGLLNPQSIISIPIQESTFLIFFPMILTAFRMSELFDRL